MAATFTPYSDMVNPAATKDGGRALGEVHIFGVITFDSSYPTNGEEVTTAIINAGLASDAQILALLRVIPLGRASVGRHVARWDDAGGKLILLVEDGTSGVTDEVADTTNVATVAIPCLVVCSRVS